MYKITKYFFQDLTSIITFCFRYIKYCKNNTTEGGWKFFLNVVYHRKLGMYFSFCRFITSKFAAYSILLKIAIITFIFHESSYYESSLNKSFNHIQNNCCWQEYWRFSVAFSCCSLSYWINFLENWKTNRLLGNACQ